MGQLDLVYKKLQEIRNRTDLKIKPCKYLKSTYTDFSGQERPLSIRYYQIQGILHLVFMKRFLLGDDCGLGKTLESIAALCYVWEQDPNRKVVVLTTRSAASQWVLEFNKFAQGIKVFLCRGTPVQRERARKAYEQAEGPAVIVMGYRSAVQDFRHLQNWKDFILVADECTIFKNPRTQVHQVCKHFSAVADRVWGLTATLIKNHLMEGFGILQGVITPGLFKMPNSDKSMTANQFMMYYCITRMQRIPKTNRQIPVIVGYTPDKVLEFRTAMDPYYLGRPKHQVATELPVLVPQILEVEMTPLQEDKYAEAIHGLLEMGEGTSAITKETSELTAISYCQEIVNHLGLIGIEAESPKVDALIDLLTEGDLASEKVIVFTRYKKFVNLIMPVLAKAGVKALRITGDESDIERDHAKKLFQDPNSDTRVICLTSAGTEAINLQAAKALICMDTPWSAGDFLQLVGRMIRIGSVHDRCLVIHLIAKNGQSRKKATIDHLVMKTLEKKMELVESVLGRRLKGVDDHWAVTSDNDITELFTALRDSARDKGVSE